MGEPRVFSIEGSIGPLEQILSGRPVKYPEDCLINSGDGILFIVFTIGEHRACGFLKS